MLRQAPHHVSVQHGLDYLSAFSVRPPKSGERTHTKKPLDFRMERIIIVATFVTGGQALGAHRALSFLAEVAVSDDSAT